MPIYVQSTSGKRIHNLYAPYLDAETGTRYNDLTKPEDREALGIIELPDPERPTDFTEESYFVTQQDDAPYVVYTKKPPEMLAQIEANKIEARLREVREMREKMLNRLMGIAFVAKEDDKNNLKAACLDARNALLDITANLPATLAEVETAIFSRYQTIAMNAIIATNGELESAFKGIDL